MLIIKIHSVHIHYLVNFYNKLNLSKINYYLSNLVKILSEWIILIGTRGKRVIALTPFLTQLDFIFIIKNFLVSIRFLSFSPSNEPLRQKKTCKNQFIWSIPLTNF
jgi:hypothetical protein